MLRFITAILIFLCVPSIASAEPKLPPGVTCDDVRSNVEKYGQRIALTWARWNGYSAKQIEQARRCLR